MRSKKKKSINHDIITAINKANREAEIEMFGKPIIFRTITQQNKKKYKRNKKVTLTDDL